MDFFKNISSKYEQFWKNIIEPQRQQYSLSDLGSNIRVLHQTTVVRKDIQVQNDRGELLECTYFLPDNMMKEKKLPIVIYLHGNSGSRVESVSTLQHLIPTFGLFCFDFSGSGKSQGKYVTMGVNECRDLESVVKYVEEHLTNNQIIIWGRSMGAVTGILYASKHQQKISGLILDSPFSDLKKVMQEIASSKTKIPSLIVDGVISLVKSKIQETLNGVDIFNTQIEEKIKYIECPILFVYGTKDTIILPYHSQTLYKACRSEDKSIVEFEGNHNTIRPNHFYQKILTFIKQVCMRQPALIKQLNTPQYNNKNTSDITRIVKQQQDVSPVSRIVSFNINNNNFYDPKPQKHLQSLPSEERQIQKVDEKQYQTHSKYISPQLHQNFREKEKSQQQQQQILAQQNQSNANQKDLTPKGNQVRQNMPGQGHVKSQSLTGQPQQKGISLVSYQQKDVQPKSPFQLSYNNINSKSDSKNQYKGEVIGNKQEFESIYPNQQPSRTPQDSKKNSDSKPARKKIFQDTFSERKQIRTNSNIPKQQGMSTNQQQHIQRQQQGDIIIDNTDQFISNQINLLQDITNEQKTTSKSPITKQFQNPTSNQASVNPFAKSPSTSALSPTSKLTFANQESQSQVNVSRGMIGQSIVNSQVQINPFLIESTNLQQTPLSNNSRQNNFLERQITHSQQQQYLQQQQQQSQFEKVKKQSNYISCRQYSLDGGASNLNNNSSNNFQNNNGKDLTDYYQYGIQFHRKNEPIQCISPNSKIQSQTMQQNNSASDQWLQQQYCSVDKNMKQCTQPSQQKIESFSEYQNQLIQNQGSTFDWNNSSFDAISQSYLNPTKNPFQLNNLQQQKQLNKQIQLINNNSNDSRLNQFQYTPHSNQQHQQIQQQLFLSDNTADSTPHNSTNNNNNYIMQSMNQQQVDKQQIIENQFNIMKEAEYQDRISRLNTRNRNLSAANAGNVTVTRPNNQENSVPRQQIIQEKQNIVINLPVQNISLVPQQQIPQSNGKKFNLVLTQSNNISGSALRDRQTLSPVNRNILTPPLPPNVNVINYSSHQIQNGLKQISQNILQPVIQQQQHHVNQPLSPFPIMLNQAYQNGHNENIQRRYSGTENNNEKIQFVSVFTQNLQNRTQREKDFNQQSQRSQFKYTEKRYVQGSDGRVIKQQQQPSLFQKVMTELSNKNQIQDNQNNYQQQPNQDLRGYVSIPKNSHLHYESLSIAEQMQPVYESTDIQKPTNHYDSNLPISHQVTNLYPKQIELHTNFSNEEQPVIYSID